MPDAAPSTELPPVGQLSFAGLIEKVGATERPSSIAIIGDPKTGKTTLAATASQIPALVKAGKKVLLMEAESGTASIAAEFPDIEMMKFSTYAGFNRAVDELLTKDHDYGVIVVDTFDAFADLGVNSNVDDDHSENGFAGWKAQKGWINRTLWRCHKSGILWIFLFHEMIDKDKKTGVTSITYNLQGSAKNDIGKIFDIIGRLTVEQNPETKERERHLQLGPRAGHVTGNRYESRLPDVMVNPTMPKIFELITGPKPTAASGTTTP